MLRATSTVTSLRKPLTVLALSKSDDWTLADLREKLAKNFSLSSPPSNPSSSSSGAETLPGIDLVVADSPSALDAEKANAVEVVFNCTGTGEHLTSFWPHLPSLKWVHSRSAGVEKLVCPVLTQSSVTLTNAKGAFSRSLAEYTLAACLYFNKSIQRLQSSQRERKWDHFTIGELHNSTMVIVGYGDIGRAVAKTAVHGFGMNIIGVKRSIKPTDNSDSLASELVTISSLRSVLPRADYVVVCTPLTPDTIGLIGEGEFSVMKPSAVLINIGRGPAVNEGALLRALQEKKIRGAALDVFDVEPLPAEHPFWGLENLLISAHCADMTETYFKDANDVFVGNLRRFVVGEPLINLVDKNLGY